jgi:hypothetical protein
MLSSLDERPSQVGTPGASGMGGPDSGSEPAHNLNSKGGSSIRNGLFILTISHAGTRSPSLAYPCLPLLSSVCLTPTLQGRVTNARTFAAVLAARRGLF